MIKKYNQTIIMLAFCSAFLDFLTATPAEMFYPRDRIIHITISAVVFFVVSYLIDFIDLRNTLIRITSFLILLARLICFVYRFTEYYRMFYGNSMAGIIIFTVIVFVVSIKFDNSNISQIGGFYILAEFLMFILLIMSADNVDTINIYSTNTIFEYSIKKMFVFFDIFTITVILKDQKTKRQSQRIFIVISSCVFIAVTIIQGLCIKGNILYSLSPLQSLIQIFSGNTIKRCDYIFNLFFTFNYFGAVILYAIAFAKILNLEKYLENS